MISLRMALNAFWLDHSINIPLLRSCEHQRTNKLDPRQRRVLYSQNYLAQPHIHTLLRAPIEKLYGSVRNLFANRDAIRDADQVGVFKLHARALIAIVEQDF